MSTSRSPLSNYGELPPVGLYGDSPRSTISSSARAKISSSRVATLPFSPRGNVRVGTASSPFLWAGSVRAPVTFEPTSIAEMNGQVVKATAAASALVATARALRSSPPQSPAEAASVALSVGSAVWGAALEFEAASSSRAHTVELSHATADARAALRAERESNYQDRAALAASAGAQVSAAAVVIDGAREELASLRLRLEASEIAASELARDAVPRATHEAMLLRAALKLRVREAAADEAAARARVAVDAANGRAEASIARAREANERLLAGAEADMRGREKAALDAGARETAVAKLETAIAKQETAAAKQDSVKMRQALIAQDNILAATHNASLHFGEGFGVNTGEPGQLVAFRLSGLPPALAYEMAFLDSAGTGDVDVNHLRHAAELFAESQQRVKALQGAFGNVEQSLAAEVAGAATLRAHCVALEARALKSSENAKLQESVIARSHQELAAVRHECEMMAAEAAFMRAERDAARRERDAAHHENDATTELHSQATADVIEALAAEEAASARAADVPILRTQLALALCALAARRNGGVEGWGTPEGNGIGDNNTSSSNSDMLAVAGLRAPLAALAPRAIEALHTRVARITFYVDAVAEELIADNTDDAADELNLDSVDNTADAAAAYRPADSSLPPPSTIPALSQIIAVLRGDAISSSTTGDFVSRLAAAATAAADAGADEVAEISRELADPAIIASLNRVPSPPRVTQSSATGALIAPPSPLNADTVTSLLARPNAGLLALLTASGRASASSSSNGAAATTGVTSLSGAAAIVEFIALISRWAPEAAPVVSALRAAIKAAVSASMPGAFTAAIKEDATPTGALLVSTINDLRHALVASEWRAAGAIAETAAVKAAAASGVSAALDHARQTRAALGSLAGAGSAAASALELVLKRVAAVELEAERACEAADSLSGRRVSARAALRANGAALDVLRGALDAVRAHVAGLEGERDGAVKAAEEMLIDSEQTRLNLCFELQEARAARTAAAAATAESLTDVKTALLLGQLNPLQNAAIEAIELAEREHSLAKEAEREGLLREEGVVVPVTTPMTMPPTYAPRVITVVASPKSSSSFSSTTNTPTAHTATTTTSAASMSDRFLPNVSSSLSSSSISSSTSWRGEPTIILPPPSSTPISINTTPYKSGSAALLAATARLTCVTRRPLPSVPYYTVASSSLRHQY
jgi:hypothetical protein